MARRATATRALAGRRFMDVTRVEVGARKLSAFAACCELHHNVGAMMTRTQLSFETENLKRARILATFCLTEPEAGSDVAADKDRMVAEAFGALRR